MMARVRFAKEEIIQLSEGIYQVTEGLIFEYPIVVKADTVDDSLASMAYGVNDYLIINFSGITKRQLIAMTKYCSVEKLNQSTIDMNLLLRQIQKASDLHAVLCHKKVCPVNDADIKSSRAYALLAWLDKYFYEQQLTLSHYHLAELCLSTRVTMSRVIAKLRSLEIIEDGRISKKANARFLK